jgi:Uncharacterized protein conserved in bacteria (DUF2252)
LSIIDDTERYESWLHQRCKVVKHGLHKKHSRMAEDPFKFFRATSYRFARKLPVLFPQLVDAIHVPSVGDAHIANWGTWRDAEGRLVWGVNDFDDAALLPYTCDLLRLATSARLSGDVAGKAEQQATAILSGYRDGLSKPGPQFINVDVLWMRELVRRPSASPSEFRRKLKDADKVEPPTEVVEALLDQSPSGCTDIVYRAWQRGGGSLGRPRFVAAAQWHGGPIVREAKALVPSSWDWAANRTGAAPLFLNLAYGRYRSPDPFLNLSSGYIIRRIAPDSQKLDTADAIVQTDSLAWLSAMGTDLASIHLGNPGVKKGIVNDLERRQVNWLADSADIALRQVEKDYNIWRDYQGAKNQKTSGAL